MSTFEDHTYIEDLLDGFPVTGVVTAGGLGIDVMGGQRCHG